MITRQVGTLRFAHLRADLHDGQFAHAGHARTACRAILSQQIMVLLFRNTLDADPKSEA